MFRWIFFIAVAALTTAAEAQVDQPVVMSDYPLYATTPAPQHQETLRQIGVALAGAASQGNGNTMLQVSVVGHADFDPRGRQLENGVSVDRAKNACDAIVAAFNAQADAMRLDESKRRLISFEYSGRGTSEALFPQSAPMAQRVQNRRVVATWASVPVIQPSSKISSERCVSRIPGSASTP